MSDRCFAFWLFWLFRQYSERLLNSNWGNLLWVDSFAKNGRYKYIWKLKWRKSTENYTRVYLGISILTVYFSRKTILWFSKARIFKFLMPSCDNVMRSAGNDAYVHYLNITYAGLRPFSQWSWVRRGEEKGKWNNSFASCPKPFYQSEAWCTTILF